MPRKEGVPSCAMCRPGSFQKHRAELVESLTRGGVCEAERRLGHLEGSARPPQHLGWGGGGGEAPSKGEWPLCLEPGPAAARGSVGAAKSRDFRVKDNLEINLETTPSSLPQFPLDPASGLLPLLECPHRRGPHCPSQPPIPWSHPYNVPEVMRRPCRRLREKPPTCGFCRLRSCHPEGHTAHQVKSYTRLPLENVNREIMSPWSLIVSGPAPFLT